MKLLSTFCLTLLLLAVDVQAADKPNILLIMADDLGFECLSCYGSDSYSTPRLDALAKGGMRFQHMHAQPLCTPTRVQLMTGIYNNRNYLRFGILDPEAKTVAHLLKEAGYKTYIAGKWQLLGGLEGPQHFGFDEYCLWQLNRRPSRYANPGLEINGQQVNFNNGEYGPDIVNDHIIEFIKRHREEPFFVYYPMMLTHGPFDPTPDSPDYDKTATEGPGKPRYFTDMVQYMDKLVGKLLDELEAQGLRDNTLVIFTGDNGTGKPITSQFQGKPYRGGKGSTPDNGTHVPLIVNWPSTLKAGQVSEALVDSTDILPTLTDIAGATVPAELKLDGHSFAPLLKAEEFTPREWSYCWYQPQKGTRAQASQHVRTARYKLYSTGKLYDVFQDLPEQHPLDVAQLPADVQLVYKMLKAALDQKVAETREINANWKKEAAKATE